MTHRVKPAGLWLLVASLAVALAACGNAGNETTGNAQTAAPSESPASVEAAAIDYGS